MRETTVERFFVNEIHKNGGLALKLTSPSMAGLPDRMALLPGGRIYFVELKATGRKARPLQKVAHNRLEGLGFSVSVLDSKEGVKEWLEAYGVCTPQVPGNSDTKNI